jgi:hypothetical protein
VREPEGNEAEQGLRDRQIWWKSTPLVGEKCKLYIIIVIFSLPLTPSKRSADCPEKAPIANPPPLRRQLPPGRLAQYAQPSFCGLAGRDAVD